MMHGALRKVEETEEGKMIREARKTNDSTFDRIYKSLFGKQNYELTEKEKEIAARWDFAWLQLCDMKPMNKVVDALCERFSVGKSVAYDDVSNAMALYGDPRKHVKEAKRSIAEQAILRALEKAWNDNNLDAYERLMGKYIAINGLDKESNNELSDLVKKLRPTALVFTLTPEQLKKEADSLISDVDFEVVK